MPGMSLDDSNPQDIERMFAQMDSLQQNLLWPYQKCAFSLVRTQEMVWNVESTCGQVFAHVGPWAMRHGMIKRRTFLSGHGLGHLVSEYA